MSGDSSGDLARQITTAVRQAAEIGTGAAVATAIHAIRPDDLEEFFHASLDTDIDATPLTTGLPASPGAASGKVVFEGRDLTNLSGEGLRQMRPDGYPLIVQGGQFPPERGNDMP